MYEVCGPSRIKKHLTICYVFLALVHTYELHILWGAQFPGKHYFLLSGLFLKRSRLNTHTHKRPRSKRWLAAPPSPHRVWSRFVLSLENWNQCCCGCNQKKRKEKICPPNVSCCLLVWLVPWVLYEINMHVVLSSVVVLFVVCSVENEQ